MIETLEDGIEIATLLVFPLSLLCFFFYQKWKHRHTRKRSVVEKYYKEW